VWPIFKVQELRKLGIDYRSHDDRQRAEIARSYVDAGARLFEPRCYYEHEESPPLDLPQTLAALVRVRNNLFHGEKARSSESDRLPR
jgi:hypothetical protein